MAKLDDLFDKKREATPILDLSKMTINSKEEFRKLFDKVPEYKIRPEKVRAEDIKIKEKDFNFKLTKKDLKVMKEAYTMADPIPPEMSSLKLEDLATVPIDWKMLTSLRPKSKLDEDFFNRLVAIQKSEIKSIAREKREATWNSSIRKSKNRAGVIEIKVVSCPECGEEFCDGKTCQDYQYECYTRVEVSTHLPSLSKIGKGLSVLDITSKPTAGTKRGRKKKRKLAKHRSRSKTNENKHETKPQGKFRRVKIRSKSEGRRTKKKKSKSRSKSDGEL